MDRAFVLQVSSVSSAARVLAGRVEHVDTGEAIHFKTVEELLAFLERVLLREQPRAPETP